MLRAATASSMLKTVQRLISIAGDPSAPFIFSSDVLAVIPLERCPESNQIPVSDCDHHFSSVSFWTAGPWPRKVLKKTWVDEAKDSGALCREGDSFLAPHILGYEETSVVS